MIFTYLTMVTKNLVKALFLIFLKVPEGIN
jgi:hypothetical protein